jgi:hypothetical protein
VLWASRCQVTVQKTTSPIGALARACGHPGTQSDLPRKDHVRSRSGYLLCCDLSKQDRHKLKLKHSAAQHRSLLHQLHRISLGCFEASSCTLWSSTPCIGGHPVWVYWVRTLPSFACRSLMEPIDVVVADRDEHGHEYRRMTFRARTAAGLLTTATLCFGPGTFMDPWGVTLTAEYGDLRPMPADGRTYVWRSPGEQVHAARLLIPCAVSDRHRLRRLMWGSRCLRMVAGPAKSKTEKNEIIARPEATVFHLKSNQHSP